MRRACPRCGTLTTGRYCKAHDGRHTGWSPTRDRAAQQRFRDQLIARAGSRCEYPDCTATRNLRACHITPLSQGGTYDLSNGRLLCREHDRATDSHAR